MCIVTLFVANSFLNWCIGVVLFQEQIKSPKFLSKLGQCSDVVPPVDTILYIHGVAWSVSLL